MSSTRNTIARWVSGLGHPAVLVPGAIALRLAQRASPQPLETQNIALIAGILGTLIAGVMLYSWRQVRAGNWSHIDASNISERRRLNLILMSLLLGGALASAGFGLPPPLTLGLGITGAMIAVIWLAQGWLKVSLHTSFAMFATLLLWPVWSFLIVGLIITALVGWSRLALARHSLGEIMLGIVFGALAGIVYIQTTLDAPP